MSDSIHPSIITVRAFGASGDGKTEDTEAIKSAIRATADSGGGTVNFPAGHYLTKPFELKSNITIHLEPGAVILASADINDYFETNTSLESPRVGLIYAQHAHHIGITGGGVIDCCGARFMDMGRLQGSGKAYRPYVRQREEFRIDTETIDDGPVAPLDRPGNLIQFIDCETVKIQDVTILNAPNWTIHFDVCIDVLVSGITIKNNLLFPNSDGIHCTSCRHVRITGSMVEAGDDAIAITSLSSSVVPTDGIIVSDCHLVSRSSGLRLGYGKSDINNCLFQNITISANRGIGIFARHEGSIRNISFSNIRIETRLHTGQWWGHGEPICLSAIEDVGHEKLGVIEGIRFTDISARSESGIVLYGIRTGHIRDVSFRDLFVEITPSPLSNAYGGNFDLRPTKALATDIFEHDESGFFARCIDGLRIHGFKLSWRDYPVTHFAHAVVFETCQNVDVDTFEGQAPQDRSANQNSAFSLLDCHNVSIRHS